MRKSDLLILLAMALNIIMPFFWYGEESANVDSIDKVMNLKFFNGKSLSDIWDDVTEVCFF